MALLFGRLTRPFFRAAFLIAGGFTLRIGFLLVRRRSAGVVAIILAAVGLGSLRPFLRALLRLAGGIRFLGLLAGTRIALIALARLLRGGVVVGLLAPARVHRTG